MVHIVKKLLTNSILLAKRYDMDCAYTLVTSQIAISATTEIAISVTTEIEICWDLAEKMDQVDD